ncbi:VOC family protein [Streptomyces acidicola]|uniref:VOC family protein n=1 Tax=Streptomyces acidicola TaxID=2596892 RepID=UPI00380913CD
MDIRSLAYLGFESPNYRAWETFAPAVLGMQVVEEEEDAVFLRMDSRHHRVVVRPGQRDDISYVGWEVPTLDALETAAREISEAGYQVERGDSKLADQRRVLALIAVTDPAGFRHEIAYGQWYQPHSFTPGRPHDGFVAEEQGLGHLVLAAPVTDEYRHFLATVLSFTVYAEFPVELGPGGATADMLFLRCNSRTHCLAIIGLPSLRGIEHFEVEAKSLSDVGIAYDLLSEHNLEITRTLGSHTIDPVVSFYFRTPSGFDMECAYGGIDIDGTVVVGKPTKTDIWGHRRTGVGPATTLRPIETD